MRALLLASLALLACSDDPPPAADVDACALLDMGPFAPVTATVSKDASTQSISAGASAFAVTLTANGYGHVKLAATAGKHVLYLDRALVVNVDPGAPISSSTSSGACATIMGRHEVTLAAGTVYFGLMTDGGAPVNVVLTAL